MHRPPLQLPSANVRLQRFTALACAAVVMLLSLLSVSPEVHAMLHAGHGESVSAHGPSSACGHAGCSGQPDGTGGSAESLPADDAGCIVTVFAQGVPVVLALPMVPAVERLIEAVVAGSGEAAWIVAERHLRPPTHAPPCR